MYLKQQMRRRASALIRAGKGGLQWAHVVLDPVAPVTGHLRATSNGAERPILSSPVT